MDATTPRRVLIVDDNDEIRQLLQIALQRRGFVIKTATNGGEAISRWQEARDNEKPFCAILMDIAMPDMTGYQVTEHIRERQRGTGTPVLLMTAYHEPIIEAHARRSDADEVLYKPLDLDTVINRIEELCQVKHFLDEVKAQLDTGTFVEAERASTMVHLRALSDDRSVPKSRRAVANNLLSVFEGTYEWQTSIEERSEARNRLFNA